MTNYKTLEASTMGFVSGGQEDSGKLSTGKTVPVDAFLFNTGRRVTLVPDWMLPFLAPSVTVKPFCGSTLHVSPASRSQMLPPRISCRQSPWQGKEGRQEAE